MYKYVNDAIQRESNIKAWKRIWKLRLIEEQNKEWKDLFYEITDEEEVKSLREYFVSRVKENKETGFLPTQE